MHRYTTSKQSGPAMEAQQREEARQVGVGHHAGKEGQFT